MCIVTCFTSMPTLMDFLTALLHGKFSGKEKEMLEPGTPPHQH